MRHGSDSSNASTAPRRRLALTRPAEGGADADLFFPVGTIGPALPQIDEAKRICRACPAQAACLAWAIDHGVTSGVWGGTTEEERRALRRPAEKK
jgi:WhiB family transcriptional regulator, redox-sensing transcriptional regulator